MAHDLAVQHCFTPDLIFAGHEEERGRALDWLIELHNQEIAWADVERQIEEFLRERGANVLHIVEQVDRARVLLGPWLYGGAQAL